MAEYSHSEDVSPEKPEPIISDAVKENVKSRHTWKRFLYMVVFALCFAVAEFLLLAVALVQFLTTLFTGETNANLLGFGKDLSRYLFRIAEYMAYGTDDRPFPFSEWESAEEQ